jgi:hypothetical protein
MLIKMHEVTKPGQGCRFFLFDDALSAVGLYLNFSAVDGSYNIVYCDLLTSNVYFVQPVCTTGLYNKMYKRLHHAAESYSHIADQPGWLIRFYKRLHVL